MRFFSSNNKNYNHITEDQDDKSQSFSEYLKKVEEIDKSMGNVKEEPVVV